MTSHYGSDCTRDVSIRDASYRIAAGQGDCRGRVERLRHHGVPRLAGLRDRAGCSVRQAPLSSSGILQPGGEPLQATPGHSRRGGAQLQETRALAAVRARARAMSDETAMLCMLGRQPA